MKRVMLLLTVVLLLAGCASGNFIGKVDETVKQAADTVWKQKDCRAGLLVSQVGVRNMSTETKAAIAVLQGMADQKSEEYLKCLYLGNVFNAYSFGSKDIISANTALIQAVIGVVK